MEKFNRAVVAFVLGFIGFLALLGWAGDIDYCEQVILRMSQEQYDSVKQLLTDQNGGKVPSERDIAHWWDEHKGQIP